MNSATIRRLLTCGLLILCAAVSANAQRGFRDPAFISNLYRPAAGGGGGAAAPAVSGTSITNWAASTVTSTNYITLIGANRVLFHKQTQDAATDNSGGVCTWVPDSGGNQTFTFLTNVVGAATAQHEDVWYLINPTTGAGHVTVTHNNNVTAQITVAVTNCNQTTPFDWSSVQKESGSLTSFSLDIASQVNDLVLNFWAVNGNPTVTTGPGQAELANYSAQGSGGTMAGASTEAGATSVTMSASWSGAARASHISFNLNPP